MEVFASFFHFLSFRSRVKDKARGETGRTGTEREMQGKSKKGKEGQQLDKGMKEGQLLHDTHFGQWEQTQKTKKKEKQKSILKQERRRALRQTGSERAFEGKSNKMEMKDRDHTDKKRGSRQRAKRKKSKKTKNKFDHKGEEEKSSAKHRVRKGV